MNDENFVIDLNKKYYPSANNWMWNYCTFLGQYTDVNGDNYDLGVLLKTESNLVISEFSFAIVYGNKPGNYISGPYHNSEEKRDFIKETIRRVKILNLI